MQRCQKQATQKKLNKHGIYSKFFPFNYRNDQSFPLRKENVLYYSLQLQVVTHFTRKEIVILGLIHINSNANLQQQSIIQKISN